MGRFFIQTSFIKLSKLPEAQTKWKIQVLEIKLEPIYIHIYQTFIVGNVLDYFQNIVKKEPDVSAAVAAIRTLMNILETFGDGKYNNYLLINKNKHS